MSGREDAQSSDGQEQEKRLHPRYLVDDDCVVTLVEHGLPTRARIEDLSQEGCRLCTAERFVCKPGRFVEVSFKAQGVSFRFGGVVRWTDGKNRLGIHFENILARRKSELTEVIEELAATQVKQASSDGPAGADGTASAAPAAVRAAQEARIDAQMGTREGLPVPPGSGTPRAGIPPAGLSLVSKDIKPPGASTGAALPAAPRRNRRAQSRHAVDTSATILLVNVGSALRGRIVDLSLSGCRILTDERFPVGIYTRVETEFHLQGLPFRLGGVIQAIHNRNTVGIRFLDLSERKRQQVQELIDEMEEMRAETPPEAGAPSAAKPPGESR